jgi:hypothetical protein
LRAALPAPYRQIEIYAHLGHTGSILELHI